MASQPTAVDNTKYPSEQHLDGYHSGFTSPVSPYNQDYSAQPAIPGSPQYIRDYNAHNAPEVLLHETGKIVVTPDCLPAGLIPITKYDVGAYSTPQVDYSSVPEVVGDPEKGERGAGLCCGLRKKWFIILTVLLALIVIGAVAGGVASSSTKKKSTNETSQEKQGSTGESTSPSKTGTTSAAASPSPKAVNTEMMPSSFLGATTAVENNYYASEAYVFYQDVGTNIRTIRCNKLEVCALDYDAWNFTGAKSHSPIAAAGNVERANNKIHLFYINSNNKLRGKMLLKGGSIEGHQKLMQIEYPAVSPNTNLAAVYYSANGDVKLWYQTTSGNLQTLYFTEKDGWSVIAGAAYNAKSGTSMAVMAWDGNSDGNGEIKDRLIRLLYVNTEGMFAQMQYSIESGWSINNPANDTIPILSLKSNNPLVAIVSSAGTIRPDIEAMTTTNTQNRVIGFGESPDSSYFTGGSLTNEMFYTYRDPTRVYRPSDPLAVTYLGRDSHSEKNYRLMHHGLDRKLYETLWDGEILSTREVVMRVPQ